MTQAVVEAVFVGVPKTITDERGIWTSSINRDRVEGPVRVSIRGLAGDKVAQPYHGSADAAICVHLADHYAFWAAHYGVVVHAGSVGENITLSGITEDQVCVGDRVRLGTATVQVSGPRVPCANLARRIGHPDWVKLTIAQNRTGFYLRVLEPGILQAGDPWILEQRVNQNGSIPAINRCMYLDFDPAFARGMLAMDGLATWWKDQALERTQLGREHWTASMSS